MDGDSSQDQEGDFSTEMHHHPHLHQNQDLQFTSHHHSRRSALWSGIGANHSVKRASSPLESGWKMSATSTGGGRFSSIHSENERLIADSKGANGAKKSPLQSQSSSDE